MHPHPLLPPQPHDSNSVVDHLQALDDLKDSVADVHIPLELVECVLLRQSISPWLPSKPPSLLPFFLDCSYVPSIPPSNPATMQLALSEGNAIKTWCSPVFPGSWVFAS